MTAPRAPDARLDPATTERVRGLIERHYGLRISQDPSALLGAAIARARADTSFGDVETLIAALVDDGDPRILEAVVSQLTIPETHFFRVTPQINALRERVIPDLFQKRAATRRLHVWSAGCSTGEEPYTLAMLLHERMGAASGWQIDLLATDVNQRSLDIARRGIYGEWSFRDTPDEIRKTYFRRTDDRWRIAESIGSMVRFVPLNLAQVPIALTGTNQGPFDLIVCRNVTIYFSQTARAGLYSELARLLAPDGWLILGPSDPPPDQLVDRDDGPSVKLEPRFLPGAILWQPQPPNVEIPHPIAHSMKESLKPGAPTMEQRLIAWRPRPAYRGPERRLAPRPPAPVAAMPPSLDPEPYLAAGLRLLESGNVEEAVTSLRRSTYLDPDNPLAHFMVGRAYLQIREAARAISATRQALRLLATLTDDGQMLDGDVSVGELRLTAQAQLRTLTQSSDGERQ